MIHLSPPLVEQPKTVLTTSKQKVRDTQQQVQAIHLVIRERLSAVTLLAFWSQYRNRLQKAISLPNKALLLLSVFLPAFLNQRKRPTEHGNRVLMLTISDIVIDPRINKVARSMADNGYEIDIICYHNATSKVEEEKVYPGVRYIRRPINTEYRSFGLFYQDEFRQAGLQRDYDYVHVNDLTTLLVGWILARNKGVPLVYDAHEMWSENVIFNGKEWVAMPRWLRTILQYYEGFLIKEVQLLFTVSPSICDEFQKRYKLPQKPYLLANYPELRIADKQGKIPSIRELCDLSDEHFVTLYLGGVNTLRNIENVIKAHQYLPEKCIFVIRGPGIEYSKTQYEELAKELGIQSRIYYLPPVGMDDVIAGASGANGGIVMLRNICNNFYWFYPNKFFEYMLAGLPVAVSNFPDVTAHVEKEKCGVVFDPDSPESIAKAILGLYENPSEARNMGQRGRESVLREYNWEAVSKVLLREYQRLY